MKRIAITGASGFIGSRLALHAQQRGLDTVALGQRRPGVESERAEVLEASGIPLRESDIRDTRALADAFRGAEVVFHLAAAQHEVNVDDAVFERVNVDGTRGVCEAARAAGVRRVVYGSTIGVFGGAGAPIDETAPLAPTHVYGRTKLEAEAVVAGFEGALETAVVRISEAYGPGDARLLKLFRGAQRGWMLQLGSGANLHHLVHVDDLLEGLMHAAGPQLPSGSHFVLAGPEAVTTRRLLEEVCRSVGHEAHILRLPIAPFRLAAALLETSLVPLGVQPPLHRRRLDFFRKSFCFSAEPLRALGFAPRVALEEGLASTVRWYRDQGWLPEAL